MCIVFFIFKTRFGGILYAFENSKLLKFKLFLFYNYSIKKPNAIHINTYLLEGVNIEL